MIILFRQRKETESLLAIRHQHRVGEPKVARLRGTQRQRTHRGDQAVLVHGLGANSAQVGDELGDRIAFRLICAPSLRPAFACAFAGYCKLGFRR
jgi:hypothetical protein